jgi:hypothetical protein
LKTQRANFVATRFSSLNQKPRRKSEGEADQAATEGGEEAMSDRRTRRAELIVAVGLPAVAVLAWR